VGVAVATLATLAMDRGRCRCIHADSGTDWIYVAGLGCESGGGFFAEPYEKLMAAEELPELEYVV